MKTKLFHALDDSNPTAGVDRAKDLFVAGVVDGFKVGYEFMVNCAFDDRPLKRLISMGLPVFLDLKIHDIPATTGRTVRAASIMGFKYMTVHMAAGRNAIEAALEASDEYDMTILGVTVLTSLDDALLGDVGIPGGVTKLLARQGSLAAHLEVDGLICPVPDLALTRKLVGDGPLLVSPGVTFETGQIRDDQKRSDSVYEAANRGADWIVAGRMIRDSNDPIAVAEAIQVILKRGSEQRND